MAITSFLLRAAGVPALTVMLSGGLLATALPAFAQQNPASGSDVMAQVVFDDTAAEQDKSAAPSAIPQVVPAEDPNAPMPAVSELTEPEAVAQDPSAPPPPPEDVKKEDTASQSEAALPEIPESVVDGGPDNFYDSEALVPTGEMGAKGTVRKVNPVAEPGSALVLVKKDEEASSMKASSAAAERALKLGRYEAALDMFDALYQKNKKDPRILMGRAVSLQRLERFDEAIGAYEELLGVRPNNVEANVNMLGLMAERYPAVALRKLVDLQQSHQNNVAILAQIAVTHAAMGNLADALRYFQIAASIDPHNANHLFNMAVVADRAGKKEEAVKYYEEALELDSVYGRGGSIPREAVFERLARLR